MSITDLVHVVRKLPGGGQVLVLNTGALITEESEAMLGALHSRSVGGIKSHLAQLGENERAGDSVRRAEPGEEPDVEISAVEHLPDEVGQMGEVGGQWLRVHRRAAQPGRPRHHRHRHLHRRLVRSR